MVIRVLACFTTTVAVASVPAYSSSPANVALIVY